MLYYINAMYYIKKFFLTLLLNIKNFLSSKKQQEERKRMQENLKACKNLTDGASFEGKKAELEKLKSEVENYAKKIVKANFGDIEKTLDLLKKENIKVFRFKSATDILSKIKEKQGFIPPIKGFEAYYLNFCLGLICDKKLVFKSETEPMFIFNTTQMDTYFLASQIYKYAAFKMNMSGFENSVRKNYKKIYYSPKASEIEKLTAGDIFAIKDAISRDVEAIDFGLSFQDENLLKQNFEMKK